MNDTDKVTNKPLDSVLCEVVSGTRIVYTDSSGRYELCNPTGKCMPECKNITVHLSNAGYRPLTFENPNGGIIYLER